MSKFFAERGIVDLVLNGKRSLLLGGIAASAINAIGTLGLIVFIKLTIDGAVPASWQSALLLIVVLAVLLAAHVAAGSCISNLGAQEMAAMRRRLAVAIAATDYERIERIGQHRIYTAFNEDLPRIALAFNALPAVMLNTVITACGLGYLAYMSLPHLLLLLLLVAAALVISQVVILRRTKFYSERMRGETNDLYLQMQALVYGNKEMKLNSGRERYFRERLFDRSVQDLQASGQQREFFVSAYNGWSAAVALILLACVLWISQYWLPMEPGQMLAFALVLLFLRGPLISMVNNVPTLSATGLALKKIRELQLCGEPLPDEQGPVSTNAQWRELVLSQVAYDYSSPDDPRGFRLAPVSLTLRQGEVVYITGGNGSGKSTLAKLILGLYRPSSGSIRFGGQEITALNSADYRAHFSAILGDYFLFQHVLDSRGERMPDYKISPLLRPYGLEAKVQPKNGAFSTLSLSQGQRKRLALLTTLAEDRPIVLFDEWAAEQDPEFRRRFYYEIIPSLKAAGKTVIAITHDEQYFHTADRIVRMSQGQLQLMEPPAPPAATMRLVAGGAVLEDVRPGAG